MNQTLTWTTAIAIALGTMAAASAAAQTGADEVAFHYILEDAEFDESPTCYTGWDPSLDGPCDIKFFEATNTADEFVFRFTQGTLNYGPGGTTSILNVRFGFEDPEGNEYMAQVGVSASGSTSSVSFSGDGSPPSDIEWTVDQDANTITARFPLESLEGAAPGALLSVTHLSVRWTHAGVLFFTNVDTIADAPEIEILGFGPETFEETLEGETATVELMFNETTNATYLYHWNATAEGPLQVAWSSNLTNGSVSLVVTDAANETVVEQTLWEAAMGDLVVDAPAAGNWTLRLDARNATGNVSVSIAPYTPPAPEPVPEPMNQTAPDDNGTALETGQPADDEGALGIPGFELAALVAAGAIAVAASAARRRR